MAQTTDNLLFGLQPIESQGVSFLARLTDGIAAVEGDEWKSPLSARFDATESFVVYDLGSERDISALVLQGDNNDRYEVALSSDGRTFQTLWVAPEQRRGGQRLRFVKGLEGRGRYLRLKPARGDDALAVTELQAFASVPNPFPPEIPRRAGASLDRRVRDHTLILGVALIFALLAARPRAKAWQYALALLPALAAATGFGVALYEAWPVSNHEVSAVRAVIAVVSAAAVVRLAFSPARYPAHRAVVGSVLALSALGGVLAFYNLGHPQFYDASQKKPTFAHYFDLRQYYTSAKYFREVGYEGTYEADLLAYSADTGKSLESLAKTPMRDLYSLRDSTVGAQIERIEARRERFTPERFEQYREDARFFRNTMGTRLYLSTLQDFGANATPFWMSIASTLFSAIRPSNTAFTILGFLDVILLLVTLVSIGRRYGLVAALFTAIVFGANDFVMYGSNWGGATLRHDWLFALGLGACALRSGRFALGGALFGLSTMIRAFPVVTLVGIGIAALWREVEAYRTVSRLPTRSELLERQRDTISVALGALGMALAAFLISWLVLPEASWIDWYKKVSLADAEPHPATLGLRVLLGGSELNQAQVLRSRWPVYVAGLIVFGGAVVLACRARRFDHAAVLGLFLVPILFSPAPYYLHLVYVFPLLAFGEKQAKGELIALSPKSARLLLPLLVLCAFQYLAAPITDWQLHFSMENVMLFATLAALLFLSELERVRAFLSDAPKREPAAS